VSPSNEYNEEIVMIVNDHWIVLLKKLIAIVIGIFLVTTIVFSASIIKGHVSTILYLIAFITATILVHWMFISFISWSLSNWIITTKRVILFNQIPFVKNNSRIILISEIHEIEKKKQRIIQNIFDYGEVHINVAASPQAICLYYIPKPSRFVNIIEVIKTNQNNGRFDIPALQAKYKIKPPILHHNE
jgi:hypothetical protein